jgi:hypothetical protein
VHPEYQQQARPQEAFHPDVPAEVSRRHRVPASLSGPGLRRVREPNPDVRAAASQRHRGPAWRSVRAWRLEQVTLQPEVRQDVRQGAVHRGGQSAACPAPALWSAQVLLSEQAWRSGQQASPGALREPQVPERALPWAPAVPKDPLPEAAEALARAVAEQRRAAWEPGVPRAVPEGEESARAAAGLQPAAATAASGRQAAVGAAAEPDGPQVAAEAAGALPGAAVLQPAEAQRADGAVLPRAAVRPGARAPQAAWPLAVPSAAASVFRQGRSLVAALARPRAAARFAHAMRCLPIASRSEPWWQAARNEGWSWWSTSPEGSLTK